MSTAAIPASFASRLLDWFDRHGRHDLPWQHPRCAYRVWISEVMLQQTQVKTVTPYFLRFIARFPDVVALAAAPLDDVLLLWAGLGYYARARNLHRAAQWIVRDHGGELPNDFESRLRLPGLGRSTAGAILAQAFEARFPILDGNVRRVLARHAAVAAWPGSTAAQKQLWALSERLLPPSRLADYTQAIMDLGASLCTQRAPACVRCPVSADCLAYGTARVADFPMPPPRRERPLRHATLLLIEDADTAILLERRPPSGIWGGLWCLPILDEADEAVQFLRDRYGLTAESQQKLSTLRHAFTHFELELHPLRIRVTQDSTTVRDAAGQCWVRLGDQPPALPAPIAKLFRQLHLSACLPCPEPSTA